jgi:hypothetical protein
MTSGRSLLRANHGILPPTYQRATKIIVNKWPCMIAFVARLSAHMSLKELLVEKMPRDTSGPLASDRFRYQHNWALCRLLDLHQHHSDYVLTLDHHEDVTVLDSESDPESIQGFQVKTKSSGNWTIAALTKQQEGAKGSLPSILRKLCELEEQFPTHVTLLQVVSNAPLSAKLEDGSNAKTKANVRFEELVAKEREAALTSLAKEFASGKSPSIEKIFEFQVSDLSLADHENHTKGKLNAALESLFPGTNYPLSAAYRALMGEITARNNNREQCSSYKDFLTKKSISKSRFDEILKSCGIAPKQPNWLSAESRLNAEHVPFALLQQLKNEWDGAILDRFEKRTTIYLRFWERVRAASESVKNNASLLSALDIALDDIKSHIKAEWAYSDLYIKACVLIYLYEC